ncbi:MAG: M15 family metallopeptidase [Barnesiella sp.]|nr:M15 family metallopeptidase [Barnesiella sp.]MBD5253867.1 M15 family metallopeptidase [Barnesiella sp.]MBD5345149.1 M15 family metallopeptidase [Bacteroides sp.]
MNPSTPSQPVRKKRRRKRKFSPRKALRLLAIIAVITGGCTYMCSRSSDVKPSPATEEFAMNEETEEPVEYIDINAPIQSADYSSPLEKMPEPTIKMKVNYFGSPAKAFNDSNHVHLAEARVIGIEPLSGTRSHWQLRRPIVKIASNADYFIDRLTFSRPYLVPEAEAALREIGRRFRDTIQARGGGDYRIKVTSVLRTPEAVKRLRRRNRNAVDSSVHQFATTFDISYAQFIADSDSIPRSVDDLKGVLSEVLKAMREEGKIWVKYERKQPCFHITARKPVDE